MPKYKILLTNFTLLLRSKKTKSRKAKKTNQQLLPRAEESGGGEEEEIHKQKEMREKSNLKFLADKGSVSLQQGGNSDVAYENQMKDIEVRSPCVTVKQAGNNGGLPQPVSM